MTSEKIKPEVFIIPHTHWDREWYEPFQIFRYKLVQLIDKLLEILENEEYYFMLDGQTIVLEDYFEIRPEKMDILLKYIREGKIVVGPWYILPDEWLVGQESLIRNLELSADIAKSYNIPLMKVGYLPDQFGHTRAIPQIFTDLTDFKAVVIWRGVGAEITTVPFKWKGNEKAKSEIFTNYLPFGYGNAAALPEDEKILIEVLNQKIDELKAFSPLPIFLLMNGSDHLFPQKHLINFLKEYKNSPYDYRIGKLEDYIAKMKALIKSENYTPPIYYGEFRSSKRAPLLQDTYSARMWIKIWDNKIEDLLVHYAEPLSLIVNKILSEKYPAAFISLAWKWLLKNQPHDSICGCSIDQTHEEMKGRYSWSESIAKSVIDESIEKITKNKISVNNNTIIVFNPTNCANEPLYFEYQMSEEISVASIEDEDGNKYSIQPLSSAEEVMFEETMKPFLVKSGMNMLPGRRLMDVYINEVIIKENTNSPVCDITIVCGKEPIGEFDTKEMKERVNKILDSKKYRRFHVKATKGNKQKYCSIAPLKAWSLNKFIIKDSENKSSNLGEFLFDKNSISNKFFDIEFNKDGTLNLYDKESDTHYTQLHFFEDWGDRGDEYTFGRIGPRKIKLSKVKRKVIISGEIFCEIIQKGIFQTYKQVNEKRTKRIGKVKIPIITRFRFYRDISRIDCTTEITNIAKDHRLRVCFNLPFKTQNTYTSTHFGVIKRKGNPEILEDHIEQPSGIQAQKRFVRVEDKNGKAAFTLLNKGLPEIELVNETFLALTLVRAIGFLSRSDYPERPMHAGPFLETPGAQELNQQYIFQYSICPHKMQNANIHSYNHGESFCTPPISISAENADFSRELIEPLLQLMNNNIRISSLRLRDSKLQTLLYNISDENQTTQIGISKIFSKISEINIDGAIKNTLNIENNSISLSFYPFELKICTLD